MSKPTKEHSDKIRPGSENAPTFVLFSKSKLDSMLLCWDSWLRVLNRSCCCCFGKLDKEVDVKFICPQPPKKQLFSGISAEKRDVRIKPLQWAVGMW